ncbi:hypothetical protein AB0D08_25200 [Kitasatospora sp. NPDC048540]|uniref:hypothetical protein n=1 Tax=unclassified Kitasatospora TaxID=2633591 RepID=UPI0007C72D39
MSERDEYVLRGGDGEADPELLMARARLARQQTDLLAALVADGPVPDGFDPEQVRTQAEGLAAKRRDTVARVAPDLAAILGEAYDPLFRRYARQHRQSGGYRADARAFAEWALTAEPATPWRGALTQWLRPAGTGRLRRRFGR